MAGDYGLNFGFRRSNEAVREGRQSVPAAGTFKQGDLVQIDPDTPGFLKHAAAATAIAPGFVGLLIQEEGWDFSIYETSIVDSYTRGSVRNSRLAAIWTGAGVKVWLKNTAGVTRADGRVISAVDVVVLTAVAVGDILKWDGTKYVKSAATDPLDDGVMRVTAISGTDYCEAVLLK